MHNIYTQAKFTVKRSLLTSHELVYLDYTKEGNKIYPASVELIYRPLQSKDL